jgi:hypothetical protein
MTPQIRDGSENGNGSSDGNENEKDEEEEEESLYYRPLSYYREKATLISSNMPSWTSIDNNNSSSSSNNNSCEQPDDDSFMVPKVKSVKNKVESMNPFADTENDTENDTGNDTGNNDGDLEDTQNNNFNNISEDSILSLFNRSETLKFSNILNELSNFSTILIKILDLKFGNSHKVDKNQNEKEESNLSSWLITLISLLLAENDRLAGRVRISGW